MSKKKSSTQKSEKTIVENMGRKEKSLWTEFMTHFLMRFLMYLCRETFEMMLYTKPDDLLMSMGGGPRVVVSTAAFHARVRGSVPGLGGLKETKLFLPHPRVKVSIVGSLRDREVACSASDRQGSNFESCVWRTVSS